MAMAKKSVASKALVSFIAKQKRFDLESRLEWEMACNTSPARGKVYSQSEIKTLYDRDPDYWDNDHRNGASKNVHIKNHYGDDFKYIVVKRHQTDGYIDEHAEDPDSKLTGNQLYDEIYFWQKYADEAESDLICPILKYFKSKSDRVEATSETAQDNVIIIAQKACFVGDCRSCCDKAEEMNDDEGYSCGEYSDDRYEEMEAFSDYQGWRDAIYNRGNCGVIFDYSKNCYKAVFIDYAL